MRKLISFFMLSFLGTAALSQEPAYIDSFITGQSLDIYTDAMVSVRAVINVHNINIQNSVYVENQGQITGNFFICDECTLSVRNSGSIQGDMFLGSGSHLVQIINTDQDIRKIYTNGSPFTILVHSDQLLHMSDIMMISGGANKIILNNSFVSLDNTRRNLVMLTLPPKIELIGTTTVNIANPNSLNGKVILSNVYGDGIIHIRSAGLDPLYVARAVRNEDEVYLQIGRETDYQKIMGPSLGRFVNNLRASNPDNKTVKAMDGARTASELFDVANKSVSLNPINLMRVAKVFNSFEINDIKTISDYAGSNLEPMYISGPGFDLYAGKINVNIPMDEWNFGVNAYTGVFDNSDELNDFSGFLYGANITASFDDKTMWMHSVLGFTISSFKTEAILYQDNTVYNPDGLSIYGVSDIGLKFDFSDDFYIAPFMGAALEHNAVLDKSDMSVSARFGGIAGFSISDGSIKYDYELFSVLQTNNTQGFGARMNFWSIADYAGGGISYELNRGDIGISHKISAELKFAF